jgi:lipopolysaccharide heptosyltransferase II
MESRAPKFEPNRILIVLHGSIGDVVRALPLAESLKLGFPKSSLSWSVEPVSLPLLKGHPAVDEIIVFERHRGWRAAGSFLAEIRAGKFDLVLDLQRHLKSGVISWWSGAAVRVGFHRADAKEINWIFNNRHIGRFGEEISKLDHYLKFAEYLGLPPAPVQWRWAFSEQERASAERHLDGVGPEFAVLFAGTRWQSKQWFPAQMARCAELLNRQFLLDVVLLGARADRKIAEEALRETQTRVTDLVGRTSLLEAIAIIDRATVAVGPDTGLAHVAAAVGTPVVSLWGATRPSRTGPYGFLHLAIQGKADCVPCERRRCTIGRLCMQSITPELIAQKVKLALAGGRTHETTHANGC